jgi:hypothetical protein
MQLWLSKPVYEFLPYFYMAGGLLALAASIYLNYWYWPTICLVAGLILLVGGLMVWLKRRDYRHNPRQPDSRRID